jgi:hypothetical protein
MSSRRRLCGTANAGSGGADPVAIKPIGSAALGHARTNRFVETVQLEHQNARSHGNGNRPTLMSVCKGFGQSSSPPVLAGVFGVMTSSCTGWVTGP